MRLCCFIFFLIVSTSGAEKCWSLARLKYSGGGDWYADPTSLPNLINRIRKDINANICKEEKIVSLLDAELYNYPILYMTGHGNVTFSEEEKKILREYLYHGGLLFADDNYGMDSSFRREVKTLFKNASLFELSTAHPVFSSLYLFPDGLPKIHKHDGKKSRMFGINILERTVILYSYESDLGDGWENPDVHNVPPSLREQALQMGVNVIGWYLQGQRSQ